MDEASHESARSRTNLRDSDWSHVARVVTAAIVSGGNPDGVLLDRVNTEGSGMKVAAGRIPKQRSCIW